MSVLAALDATRLCARWSDPLADPVVWARPVPTPPRTSRPSGAPWSWRGLVRNPQAILLTGMVGTSMVTEATLRLIR